MKRLLLSACVAAILLLSTGCQRQDPRYVIGVSQCSADIWREKQNAELRMGSYFQDGVELRFAAAYDSDERQIQQIDSLLETGIDLLIVAPNQVQTISPAIDRAFDSGIPVIVFERKTSSQKYTAFISADNYEMGHVMGEYIVKQLNGKGRVMEVKGLEGSSPAIERHKGFVDALQQAPDVELVATLQGDWTEESAVKAVQHWLSTPEGQQAAKGGIDYVFGQNDRMAIGARRAVANSSLFTLHFSLTKYCGIDGLPGEQGGIRLVRDSILDASYLYPTHGDSLLQLAVDILEGRPYDKETRLMSAIVTRDNASVLLMESEEILRQSTYLDRLHQKADTYLQELGTQRIVTLLACFVIILLLAAIVLFYRYHIGKMTLRRERVINTLWNLKPEDVASLSEKEEQEEQEEDIAPSGQEQTPNPVEQSEVPLDDNVPSASTSLFITRFKEVVEQRLENSEVTVEDLAAEMNLSRVQLYRKVKSVTGSTPVELLRTARLNRGYQLLLTTDKSVSEVAYQVGFTAPSYFTKCFKDEYGFLPGDVRQH
jgi:ABC-type sugar transport system substrate-binding protein/AraC-like DNA-binding protein